jgi:hypothetical protein
VHVSTLESAWTDSKESERFDFGIGFNRFQRAQTFLTLESALDRFQRVSTLESAEAASKAPSTALTLESTYSRFQSTETRFDLGIGLAPIPKAETISTWNRLKPGSNRDVY